jgi:hypothetical protein
MPKKDTIEYRLYMKNYMSKKRGNMNKPITEDYVISFYDQEKHKKKLTKVLRGLLRKCYFLEWLKKYDNVMEELEDLYPAYCLFRLTKD